MSENDYAKLLTNLWSKSGEAFTAAQQAMLKEMGGRHMLADPLMAWQAFASGDPKLQHAADTFQKLMSAWNDLGSTIKTEHHQSGADPITAELLQKIFNPREWMSAVGFVDQNIRRLSEGPKFADIGQMEGKFAALMKAWAELRTASIEHQTHVLEAWTKAAGEFVHKLNEAMSKGTPLRSRSEIVGLWVDIANGHLLEAQSTPPFLDTQRKLLRASTDVRLAQQELADIYADLFGLPTRAEIDDIVRLVTDMRRELRAQRPAQSPTTR